MSIVLQTAAGSVDLASLPVITGPRDVPLDGAVLAVVNGSLVLVNVNRVFKPLTLPGGFTLRPASRVPTLASAATLAMQWSRPPVFTTTGQKFGSAALTDGTGTISFVVPQNANFTSNPSDQGACTIECMLFYPSDNNFFTGTDFMSITDSNGTTFGFRLNGGNMQFDFDGLTDLQWSNDGNFHHIYANLPAAYGGQMYCQPWYDGGSKRQVKFGDSKYLRTGPAVATIDMTQLPPGSVLDALVINGQAIDPVVPTAEPSSTPRSLVLLNFNADALNLAHPLNAWAL